MRRGLIPWPRRSNGSFGWSTRTARVPWLAPIADETWMWGTLLAQVAAYKPDVVHVACMDLMPEPVVSQIAALGPIVVGQIAADPPRDRAYNGYALVVSSIPDLVDRFRNEGVPAELLPLAFEPKVLRELPNVERDIPVSFVGSFSRSHPDRAVIVEEVARAAPLQTWTASRRALPIGSPIARTVQGEAFGKEMYQVLARSRITLNTHARVAGRAANNLRLYEATGMGALLVTERRENLDQLFRVGSEVIAYDSPREAAEVVRYFVEHPDEGRAIAAAGQARTLSDHSWTKRMSELIDILGSRV